MIRLVARLQATKPLRVWSRMGDARGGILAGGIAYFGFFSLVPALTLGFTVFGYVLGGSEQLQRQVAQRVNASTGFTLIGTSPGNGVVQLSELVQPGTLTLTGVFGLVALVYAGLGWLQATREGIRAMFGVPAIANPVLARIRDAAAALLLGLAVLVSLVAGLAMTTLTGRLTSWLGWDGTPLAQLAVSAGSSTVLFTVDAVILLLFLTVLAGAPVPVRDLRSGAALGAVGMQVLKLVAGMLVQRVTHNPVLASSVVVVGMLVWMNLAGRVVLLAAAWAAVTAADRGHLESLREGETGMAPAERRGVRPGRDQLSRARRAEPMPPAFGQRSADRVTLAAGMVLGAGALIGARIVGRALRTVRDVVRG